MKHETDDDLKKRRVARKANVVTEVNLKDVVDDMTIAQPPVDFVINRSRPRMADIDVVDRPSNKKLRPSKKRKGFESSDTVQMPRIDAESDGTASPQLTSILEATAVNDDELEELEKERKRLEEENMRLTEERQKYLNTEAHDEHDQPPLVHAVAAKNNQDESQLLPKANLSKRMLFLLCVLILILLIASILGGFFFSRNSPDVNASTSSSVSVPTMDPIFNPSPTLIPTETPTVFPSMKPTQIPTTRPTRFPTQLPTLQPTPDPRLAPTAVPLSQCPFHCQGQTGIPVTVNGPEFKGIIKEYLNNPSTSPYGSNINCWDVSQVKDMSFAFRFTSKPHSLYDNEFDDPLFVTFNEPLGCWNVSSATNLTRMFLAARDFNQDIRFWDVSKVTDMSNMFMRADAFNQDISSWNVSSVEDMSYMFSSADTFNQDIRYWDVSNVQDMKGMFQKAAAFNQDIESWDVSSVTNMKEMFQKAVVFNQDLGIWNVSSVTDMNSMFESAYAFNQNIGSWNVSKVTDMSFMFHSADAFNKNLCTWRDKTTDQVDLSSMFLLSGCPNTSDPTLNNWCGTCPA